MAAYNKFNQFVEDLGEGVHDFRAGGDVLRVALTNSAPVATDSVFGDITEIAAGNGYTVSGEDVNNSQGEVGGLLTVSGDDVTWTAAGGTIGPFQYVVLYNSTVSAPQDPLISWWDNAAPVTLNPTETFTIDFPSGVLFTIQ